MPIREMAVQASQSRSHMVHAVHRLLYRLKHCLRVYPMMEDDKLPEHDIVWVEDLDGGPEKILVDAMMTTPALWLQTLPDEVCIVPRKALAVLGVDSWAIDALANQGANIILARSAQRLHEEMLQGGK